MTGMKTLPKKKINDELEERVREALAERAEAVTPAQFEENMKAIADGH